MILDINKAGTEFVTKVLSLYRSAKYYREKEVLAKKLLDCAIEAGRLTTEMCSCAPDGKSMYAVRAFDELGKAVFLLKIMSAESVYPKRRVNPVIEYGESLRALISGYIVTEEYTPAPAQIELKDDGGEQLSLLTEITENDGGFNEIYTGKI